MPQTLAAVRGLAQRYASQPDVVTSINLLNEPYGPRLDLDGIKQFYWDGRGIVGETNGDTAIVIHEAFQDVTWWNGFMAPGSLGNPVILDTHPYQIFTTGEVAMTPTEHIRAACDFGRDRFRNLDKWTIVGEWSGAQTDCAKWLNGMGRGARYDGTFPGSTRVGDCVGKYQGTVDALSGEDKYNLRRYIEAQLDAYEQSSGWIYWTWKTESGPEWNMKALLEGGLFPQPLTSRQCE